MLVRRKRLLLRKLPRKDKARSAGMQASSQRREEGRRSRRGMGTSPMVSVGDSVLPLQVAWVPPLVKELEIPHAMQCGQN